MYTVFLSLRPPSTHFPSGTSLGDPVTSASNDSVISSNFSIQWQYRFFTISDLIWFDFINFEVLKIRCFDAKEIALFWFWQKIHRALKPTRIYAHQKRYFSGYKPWAYARNFTVLDYNDTFDETGNGFTRWRTKKHLLVPKAYSVLQLHFILLFLNYIGKVQCESPNNRLDKF